VPIVPLKSSGECTAEGSPSDWILLQQREHTSNDFNRTKPPDTLMHQIAVERLQPAFVPKDSKGPKLLISDR
jgi:hypothetical protein